MRRKIFYLFRREKMTRDGDSTTEREYMKHHCCVNCQEFTFTANGDNQFSSWKMDDICCCFFINSQRVIELKRFFEFIYLFIKNVGISFGCQCQLDGLFSPNTCPPMVLNSK